MRSSASVTGAWYVLPFVDFALDGPLPRPVLGQLDTWLDKDLDLIRAGFGGGGCPT
jgi:hypothetical protein